MATTGIPIKPPGKVIPQMFTDGTLAGLSNIAEDVTLAARDALLNMIDLLTGANGAKSPAPKKLGPNRRISCQAWPWTFTLVTSSMSRTFL